MGHRSVELSLADITHFRHREEGIKLRTCFGMFDSDPKEAPHQAAFDRMAEKMLEWLT